MIYKSSNTTVKVNGDTLYAQNFSLEYGYNTQHFNSVGGSTIYVYSPANKACYAEISYFPKKATDNILRYGFGTFTGYTANDNRFLLETAGLSGTFYLKTLNLKIGGPEPIAVTARFESQWPISGALNETTTQTPPLQTGIACGANVLVTDANGNVINNHFIESANIQFDFGVSVKKTIDNAAVEVAAQDINTSIETEIMVTGVPNRDIPYLMSDFANGKNILIAMDDANKDYLTYYLEKCYVSDLTIRAEPGALVTAQLRANARY